MELQVEFNPKATDILKLAEEAVLQHQGGTVLITPKLDSDYWLLRVKVSETQAIVAFPKFCVTGIGFQHEDKDWNTNLPSACDPELIYNHIRINDRGANRDACLAAIRLVQQVLTDNEKLAAAKRAAFRAAKYPQAVKS